ncbi:hypothetical protein BAE44_0025185 [Dichanthelium oligosanthes]|uniref:Uncharacterized protein n=1 Tax=Dichanthelium oligosanthes TaxID=888268 RepID=A0A1E5ULY4_9POAL|nr:hypothetical protein BAE44_0025185 [Dichanthelium oligosanthes]
MFHETVLRIRITPSTRIGATSQSLLQELIIGAIPTTYLYIPNEHQVDGMKKDYKVGWFSQVATDTLDAKLRDDLERLKKIIVD